MKSLFTNRFRTRRVAVVQEKGVSSLPPVGNVNIRLKALSLVSRLGETAATQLQPIVERDRNARLLDVSNNTVLISVRDTVRAVPVLEIVVEWVLALHFVDAVQKEDIIMPINWQWTVRHVDPYTAEIVAHVTLRSGLPPIVLHVA